MRNKVFVGMVNRFFSFIFCERSYFFSGDYSFSDIKAALGVGELRKYSWLEFGDKVIIKKKSIFLPVSHCIFLRIYDGGILCEVKVRAVERFFLILILSALFLLAASTPIFVLIAAIGSQDAHDLLMIAPAFFAASIALMAWLKLVCFFLAYFSGVSKLAGVLVRLLI